MRSRHLWLAVAALCAAPAAAQTQTTRSCMRCQTSGLKACVGVQVTTKTAGIPPQTTLTIAVRNLTGSVPGSGDAWNAISNLYFRDQISRPSVGGSAPGYVQGNVAGFPAGAAPLGAGAWFAPGGIDLSLYGADGSPRTSLGGCTAGTDPTPQPRTCDPQGYTGVVTFSLVTSFLVDEAAMDGFMFAVTDERGVRQLCDQQSTDCRDALVTPEPVSIALLGTGPVSIGAARLCRRRDVTRDANG